MALVLGGTAYRIYHRESELLGASLDRRGHQVVSLLARFVVQPLFEQNTLEVQQIVDELKQDGVYAIVMGPDGFYKAHNQPMFRDPGLTDEYAAEILRTFKNPGRDPGEALVLDVYRRQDSRILKFKEYVLPVRLRQQLLGYVRVGFDAVSEIETPVEKNQKALIATFLPGLIAGIGLAILLANLIIRPVQVLVFEASEMARGNFDRNVDLEGPHEIQVLSEAFNHMCRRIREHVQEIASANDKLDRRIFELEVLYDVARAMNFKSYSPELLDYLLDTTARAMKAEWASLMLMDEETGLLTVTMVRGANFDRHLAPRLRPGQGIAGLALEKKEPILANEGYEDPRFFRLEGREEMESAIRQLACAPLLVDNCAIGVLNVCNALREGGFSPDDARLLMALASVAARAIESAKLYDQAIRECKTGLYVPSYFDARVLEQVTAGKRFDQKCALLMIDIDHFKKVNDTFGHMSGDEVLIKVARFVKETLREGIDVASRFGGEEFAILLARTDREGAFSFAERLRQRIEREVGSPEIGPERVTVSIGVAVYPDSALTVDGLKKSADTALYEAKGRGRNQVVLSQVQAATENADR